MNDMFLSGAEVYQAIRQLSDDRQEIWRFFYFKSPLWKSIYKHIAESKDNVLCSIPVEYSIVVHRGTGHSISLREFGVYAKNYDTQPPSEPSMFWMKLSISLFHEYDSDVSFEYRKQIDEEFSINVPTDLMFDFTENKFNSWISDLRRTRDEIRLKDDDQKLKRLITLYPEKAKLYLQDL